jgi:asparagine synthase (glutamine-hydrolysing)
VPLLDLEMVDWAEGLAPTDRLRRLQTKSLMKRALTRLLPAEILHRPKKGFGMPVAAWLRGPLRPLMEELLSPGALARGGLFRPEGARDLVRRHLEGRADERKALWTLLAFRLWQEAGR